MMTGWLSLVVAVIRAGLRDMSKPAPTMSSGRFDRSLAEVLSDTARATREAANRPSGAINERILAARVGLTVAGVVSELLHDFMSASSTRRDAFTVSAQFAVQANDRLDDLVDAEALAEYGQGTAAADLDALRSAGAVEIRLSSDVDLEAIASAMINLGAAVHDLLKPIANHPLLAVRTSAAAQVASEAATMIWAHYGGDGGGW